MPPFAGPLPPGMMGGAPMNAGPATAPAGAPGQIMGGMADIKTALEALQKALPGIPMGTELHEAVMQAVSKIGKHMTEMQSSPQMQMQNLLQMIARAKQAQPNAAMMGALAPGGPPPGGPGGPGGAPPMPNLGSPAPGGAPPPGAPPPA